MRNVATVALTALALVASPRADLKVRTYAGPDYAITSVPLTSVRITDNFWRPRMEINRTVSIPHILKQNEITPRISNFLKSAKQRPGLPLFL